MSKIRVTQKIIDIVNRVREEQLCKTGECDCEIEGEFTETGLKIIKNMEAFDRWLEADPERMNKWNNAGPNATINQVFGTEENIFKGLDI